MFFSANAKSSRGIPKSRSMISGKALCSFCRVSGLSFENTSFSNLASSALAQASTRCCCSCSCWARACWLALYKFCT